jgi:hypothetical protein
MEQPKQYTPDQLHPLNLLLDAHPGGVSTLVGRGTPGTDSRVSGSSIRTGVPLAGLFRREIDGARITAAWTVIKADQVMQRTRAAGGRTIRVQPGAGLRARERASR